MKPTQIAPFEGMYRKPKRQIVIPEAVATRAATRCVPDAESGCWISTYSTASHGYAQVGWQVGGDRFGVTAHRAAWVFWAVGQIPEGMTIDHTCHNRQCVNPSHLRMLPNFENARRTAGRDWPLGECRNGHPNSELITSAGRLRCGACYPKPEPKPKRVKGQAPVGGVTPKPPKAERRVRQPKPAPVPRTPLTVCKRGHAFTPENTYAPPSRPEERWCRECMSLRETTRPRRRRVSMGDKWRWETASEVAARLAAEDLSEGNHEQAS